MTERDSFGCESHAFWGDSADISRTFRPLSERKSPTLLFLVSWLGCVRRFGQEGRLVDFAPLPPLAGLSNLRKTILRDLEDNAQESFGIDRDALSMFGYLWQWLMTVAETQAKSTDLGAAPTTKVGSYLKRLCDLYQALY